MINLSWDILHTPELISGEKEQMIALLDKLQQGALSDIDAHAETNDPEQSEHHIHLIMEDLKVLDRIREFIKNL